MLTRLTQLEEEARSAIDSARDMQDLQAVRVRFLGKKGEITALLRSMGQLPPSSGRSSDGEPTVCATFWSSCWGKRRRS